MTETLPTAPLDVTLEGPRPPRSVAESLRAQYEQAQAAKTIDLAVPGTDRKLWSTFKAVTDFEELFDATDPAGKRRLTEARQRISLSIDLICVSSVTAWAVDDNGNRQDFNAPLGLDVYTQIFEGVTGVRTDQEAVRMLFPGGTSSIVQFATLLQLWQDEKANEVDGELLGNF
jgi:hypothetical protein